MGSSAAKLSGHVPQLDGLRGLASAVVVLSHLMLIFPVVSSARNEEDRASDAAWLTFSPLHLLWDGTIAVWIFFVLSGYVLTSAVSRRNPQWLSYYPRRIIRLYLPVAGALVFTVILMLVVPRVSGSEYGSVINDGAVPLDPVRVLLDEALLGGTSNINGVLWSLQWEMWYSLLLPLYVWVAYVARRWWLAKMAAFSAIQFAAILTGQFWLFAMTLFAYGAVLFVERESVTRLIDSLGRRWVVPTLAVLSLALLNAPYWPVGVPASSGISSIGAVLMLVVFLESRVAIRIGSAAISRWLGKISFSLYLTHLPVLLAVVALFGSDNLWPAVAVTAVTVLPIATGFYYVCERPSHRLSQKVGRALRREWRRTRPLDERL